MVVIVAGKGRIRAAAATTRVNGVVPVVGVIRVHAIPAAILLLECRVRPRVAGVLASDDHVITEAWRQQWPVAFPGLRTGHLELVAALGGNRQSECGECAQQPSAPTGIDKFHDDLL